MSATKQSEHSEYLAGWVYMARAIAGSIAVNGMELERMISRNCLHNAVKDPAEFDFRRGYHDALLSAFGFDSDASVQPALFMGQTDFMQRMQNEAEDQIIAKNSYVDIQQREDFYFNNL